MDDNGPLYCEMKERYERLKSDIAAAIEQADQGLCESLDIEAINAELIAELDEDGQPRD